MSLHSHLINNPSITLVFSENPCYRQNLFNQFINIVLDKPLLATGRGTRTPRPSQKHISCFFYSVAFNELTMLCEDSEKGIKIFPPCILVCLTEGNSETFSMLFGCFSYAQNIFPLARADLRKIVQVERGCEMDR